MRLTMRIQERIKSRKSWLLFAPVSVIRGSLLLRARLLIVSDYLSFLARLIEHDAACNRGIQAIDAAEHGNAHEKVALFTR